MTNNELLGASLTSVPSLPPTLPSAEPAVDDQRLQTLFEIAKILATEHTQDVMVPKLLTCLMSMSGLADAGLLMIYDERDSCLKVRAAQGYDLTVLRHLCLTPDESMTGKAFRTGRAEVYPTSKATAAVMATMTPANRAIFRKAAFGVTEPLSAICIPLIANQIKVGVLVLENLHQQRSFSAEDLAFLQPVADLLAMSIENARLRDELQAVRSLSEANRLKAEVISTLAHEMRTPLTSIKGYSTALLLDEVTFSPETQSQFLQIIDEECDVLQDLIHDLLESSVIDAGFLRLELQPVLVPHLVKQAIEDLTHSNHRHRFLTDFIPHFPIVDADPQRVTQVLRNLLDNAIKYSPEGSLVVVRGEVTETEVIISVADQGEGIAPEHLNQLFDRFFRIKTGLGRHVAGTGLGLPISRAIVESHGGRIWADSQVGKGTTFSFTIPRREPDQDESLA